MSDIYTTLRFSPRKKRCPSSDLEENTFTPKKLRIALVPFFSFFAYQIDNPVVHFSPPTPPPTNRKKRRDDASALPSHLSRLDTIHTALQQALSHALATCAVSPASDTGTIRNVLNHYSLNAYTGLTTHFQIDDLRRLCWLWEWDGHPVPTADKLTNAAGNQDDDDDENPFLDTKSVSPPPPKDWKRGAMGIVVSAASHKLDRKRVPAYGIGIEVEIDIDKDMTGGMAAVARWTGTADSRKQEFREKLKKWNDLHSDSETVPQVPLADLPKLASPTKMSGLTRLFAAHSPKAASTSVVPPTVPSSPTRTPMKSPLKHAMRDFAIPFPKLSPLKTPTKRSTIPFPSPARSSASPFPQTPRHRAKESVEISVPSTPVHQRGTQAPTFPETPSSSRRRALYERIRQKSLTASPSKSPLKGSAGSTLTRDQMLKLSQDEMRRRCLLGRLSGVAESVWMRFSTPTPGMGTPSSRKRRTLPTSDVAAAVMKSSPVPISLSEANESLEILTKLCPFFLKPLVIGGQDWLEMPPTAAATPPTPSSSTASSVINSPIKGSPRRPPASPGSSKLDKATELLTRSPKRVANETGGLRQVREIIRRELELSD
ncbi:hypothetical protein FISHEDRAFT_41731 [Fistulina hepatica ATCC 64428]|nr:hypothetical protein FISHEDRAFT_41731 [Fistulina hepatica ATCC 64428]